MNKLLVAATIAAALGLSTQAFATQLPGKPEFQRASAAGVTALVAFTIINGSDTPTVKTTPGPGPGPGEECEEGEELVNGVCVPSTTTTVTTSVTTTLPVTTTVTVTGGN